MSLNRWRARHQTGRSGQEGAPPPSRAEKGAAKHFLKAILLSLRYKWTILFSVVNAMLIALLFGMSISAVYPFVEVVFEGKTVRTWVDGKIQQAEEKSDQLRSEVEQLRGELKDAAPGDQGRLSGQITIREGRLAVYERTREFYTSIRPAVLRWGPATPFGTLMLVISLLLVATAIKGVCLVLNVVLVAKIAAGTVTDMRRIFFRRMLKMDQAEIDRVGTTRLMTMLSHNVNLVRAGLQVLYGKSIREPLKILACLALACLISWRLLLLSMAVAPLGCYLIHYLAQRMKRAATREISGITAVFQSLLDTLTGMKLVKIFTRERYERHRFKKHARTLYKNAMRISFYDALIRPVTELMAISILAIATLCGAYLVLNQQTHIFGLPMSGRPLSASEMFTFFAVLAGIADPARKLSDIYNVLVRAVMASRSLFSTFEKPPTITDPPNPVPAPHHSKSIRFENVTFGYTPNAPVLKNVSVEIPFGQVVALVGPNGSGKSTFANLIARFYDPQEGRILLDDVDLRDVRHRQLRKQIGIVTQEPVLFRGTVHANVHYGDHAADGFQVQQAARWAHVSDFLPSLSHGLQSEVGDRGCLLSGGQRQRVALARAILSNPRILILDEATSQLDARAEAAVHQSLREFLRERTTILVTHRPSTLMLADRVLVFRAGEIVHDISRSELLSAPSAPATLLPDLGQLRTAS